MVIEEMKNSNLKISIITVCRNAEHIIEKTIKSVLGQKYKNIEYIIVDGNSQDKTLDIVMRYAKGGKLKYISETDGGIYDAMNKGILIATGEYLQFLNAGDALVNCDVITKVVGRIAETQADIVYGNILYEYPDGSKNVRVYGQFCSKLFYYLSGDCINHQAIFAAKRCLGGNGFNTTYRICADREWMLRMKKSKRSFRALNLLICSYSLDTESVSVKNHDIYKSEAERCILENFRVGYSVFWLINKIREGKVSAGILHGLYKLVYIRK